MFTGLPLCRVDFERGRNGGPGGATGGIFAGLLMGGRHIDQPRKRPLLKCAPKVLQAISETSQGPWTGRGSKIENANCRQRGAEGSMFAGLLPSRVDFRRGRKLCDNRGRSLHICRVVFKQG